MIDSLKHKYLTIYMNGLKKKKTIITLKFAKLSYCNNNSKATS